MSPHPFLWPSPEQLPPLANEQVHVWAWDLELPPLPRDWAVLNSEETLRAHRFVFPRDRDRYVRAHSILRTLLSGYCALNAAELIFSSNEYGKPEIQNPLANPVHFNLTHSAGIAALAASRSYRLGVDLEILRPIDADIAEQNFSPRELHGLKNLPPGQWLPAFYRCWTAKEALLKGVGLGLNIPLDAFDVEVDPKRQAALLASRPPTVIAAEWQLFDLKPTSSAIGTLAVCDATGDFQPDQLQCFSFNG